MRIAIIDSPLQALNVIEYLNSHALGAEACCFIIFSNAAISLANMEQIEHVLSVFGCSNRRVLNVNGGFKGLIRSRRQIKALAKEFLARRVEICVLGEYRSLSAKALVNGIRPRNVVVVDDGNATLRIDRRSTHAALPQYAKQFLARLYGFSLAEQKAITFFSVYNIANKISKHDCFELNDYSHLKQEVLACPRSKREFIIGSPLQSAGVLKSDLGITLRLIDSVLEQQSVNKSDLLYVAHRRESQEKLAKITAYGIEVVLLPYPFELYALMSGENAFNVSGFYSSVFPNLLNLNDCIAISSYQIDLSRVHPKFRGFVSSVYRSYQAMNDARLCLKQLNANE